VPGFGHAETGTDNALVDRIGRWIVQATGRDGGDGETGHQLAGSGIPSV
jgi:hypothetical protein